jgi:hypothetical protein
VLTARVQLATAEIKRLRERKADRRKQRKQRLRLQQRVRGAGGAVVLWWC